MSNILLFLVLLFYQPIEILIDSNPNYLIRQYDIEDGLPVNAVNGIEQDNDGYLYFSTYDGLVRYDGYKFEIYNSGNIPEMRTNRIAGLLSSSDGTVWLFNEVGTVTSKKRNVFKTFSESELPGLSTRIVEDFNGQIWIGGSEGLAFFSKEDSVFKKIEDSKLKSFVKVLMPSPSGALFVVNNNGLYSVKNKSVEVLLTEKEFTTPVTDVRDIQVVDENYIWIISTEAAFLYSIDEDKIEETVHQKSTGMFLSSMTTQKEGKSIINVDSKFFVLGADNQPYKILDNTYTPADFNLGIYLKGKNEEDILIGENKVIIDNQIVLDGPKVKYAMVDIEGSIWLGTDEDGVYQIRKSSFVNLTNEEIPGFTNIYTILEDKENRKWACSFKNGIYSISEGEYKNWNNLNSKLPNSLCKYLFEDTDGTIFASTNNGGLWKLVGNDWQNLKELNLLLKEYDKTVEALHRKGSQLLISNANSLIIFENNEFSYFDESQPQELSRIQVFRESFNGIIFVGTKGNGISRIDGESYINYTTKNGVLNSNAIRDIFLQSDDTLWVVNESLGLNRIVFNKEGQVLSSKSITVNDGLSQNSLHRILDDGLGYFWISGNSGIMRVSQKELNAYANGDISELHVLNFDEKDGMVNREANGGVQSSGIRASDGKLWFPNQKGISIIDPFMFGNSTVLGSPTPIIESIELSNKVLKTEENSEITLPKNERNLRINISAPNFAQQDRVELRYKLKGVNTDWENAKITRQAVFTNLPPGTHTFVVSSARIGSNPIEKILTITVPYFFYETLWFKILISLLGFSILLLGYVYRVRSLEQKQKMLANLVDEKTHELKEAIEQKSRFFTGITHELKTPLSLIISPIDDLMEKSKSGSLDSAIKMLPLIQRNSYRLKNLVDQILDVSKLNADAISLKIQPINLFSLTRQIIGQFHSKLEQEEISIEISTNESDELIYVDKEAWERIVINLMSNAIKFSPAKSIIKVSFVEHESEIQVKIKDEGKGISSENQHKIFNYLYQVEGDKAVEGTGIGLFLVKGLMEEMGGSITLSSELGEGAEFILTLKKGYQHVGLKHTLLHDPLLSDDKLLFDKTEQKTESTILQNSSHEHRILVVEDNYDFRGYLQSILEEQYDVLLAKNGKEALKILKKEVPDLIISDIMMPEMNGLEFVNSLRSQKKYQHLPVIFLSAKNDEQDVKAGLSTGADVYLSKPIRSSMLLAQIVAILRREHIIQNRFTSSKIKEKEPKFLRQVREIIFRQLANPSLNVGQLADALYISRSKLYSEWRKVSKVSVNEFIKKTRLNEAQILLKEKGFTVQEAARAVGYADANYFSTSFKQEFGYPPSTLIKQK